MVTILGQVADLLRRPSKKLMFNIVRCMCTRIVVDLSKLFVCYEIPPIEIVNIKGCFFSKSGR